MNPNSDIPDIDAIAEIAHRHGLPLVIDNTFDKPQRAAVPGQAAVLYAGDTVLGGGTIRAETKSVC